MKVTKTQLRKYIVESIKALEEDARVSVPLDRVIQQAVQELVAEIQQLSPKVGLNFDQLNAAAGSGGLNALLYRSISDALDKVTTTAVQPPADKKTGWGKPRAANPAPAAEE